VSAVYNKQPVHDDLYQPADELYASIKAELCSEAFRVKSEADLQRWLMGEQRELMRRLMQAHLTLRGQEEASGAVVGSDGVERTHMRQDRSRELESVFGTVEAKRAAHGGRGLSELHPVDGSLNLPASRYSHEVERQVAKAAAHMSFDSALDTLDELLGAHVPKRQAEDLVQQAARDFDAFYDGTRFEAEGPTGEFLVLSFDQKGVVLRKEDLTEATQKALEASRSKLETRTSKGEPKRGRKRMSMVAAVYTVAPHVRTAQDVIAGLRHLRQDEGEPRPRPEYKRVWASLLTPPRQVVADAFEEASQRDPERKKRWLAIVDGDPKLARWIRAAAKRCGVQITLVLDFIHALEYLWKAGHVFHQEATPEIEAWVLERLERMLDGKASGVAAGMTRMATMRGISAEHRKPVDKAAKYLLRRKSMMRYDQLLPLGTPIASGVIEGACRHLINDRLDVTGARWSLSGAEAVLRLRSLLSSGDFDTYWEFHEEAELARNHLSRYAGARLPELSPPRRRVHLRRVK
jgi:hypothetical protein